MSVVTVSVNGDILQGAHEITFSKVCALAIFSQILRSADSTVSLSLALKFCFSKSTSLKSDRIVAICSHNSQSIISISSDSFFWLDLLDILGFGLLWDKIMIYVG